METKQNKIKSFSVGDKELRQGVCSCLPARVLSKEFDLWLSPIFPDKKDKYTLSLTEAKIIEYINEADSIKIEEGEEGKYLIIDLEEYKVIVIFKEDNKKGVE